MIMNRLFNEFTAMAINHNWITLLVAAATTSLLLTITNGNHIFCRYIWFCLPTSKRCPCSNKTPPPVHTLHTQPVSPHPSAPLPLPLTDEPWLVVVGETIRISRRSSWKTVVRKSQRWAKRRPGCFFCKRPSSSGCWLLLLLVVPPPPLMTMRWQCVSKYGNCPLPCLPRSDIWRQVVVVSGSSQSICRMWWPHLQRSYANSILRIEQNDKQTNNKHSSHPINKSTRVLMCCTLYLPPKASHGSMTDLHTYFFICLWGKGWLVGWLVGLAIKGWHTCVVLCL